MQTFLANSDRTTVVKHFFSPDTRIFARSIRFHPKAWHGHVSMRVEIYGCEKGKYLFHLVHVKKIRLSRLYSNASQRYLQHLEGLCSPFLLFQRILDCFGDYDIPALYGGYVIL